MSHTIGQAEQHTQESNSNSNQSPQDSFSTVASPSVPVSGLSDTDYEFLFNQLLEGIAHGWHDRRIIKFFTQLGDRGKQADWVAWFDRLRDKLLKLPIESKRQLGTMMIRFGELTQSATEVNQIGAASHRLGRELLFGDNVSTIWEYVGPDLGLETKPIETISELSERLPSDFVALGDELTEDVALDSATAADLPLENNNYGDLLQLEIDEMTSSVSQVQISLEAENNAADPRLNREATEATFLETLVSADELWAEDLLAPDSDLSQFEDVSQNLDQNSLALEQQREGMPTISTSELDDSSLELIESWFNLGLKQVSAGEYNKAIASWDKALNINANLPEAWHNRGSALGRLGNYEAAVKSFQNALEIDPDNHQAWNDRAHALYQLQDWSGAVECWSQAIKIMPGNHLFWYNRGCSLEQLAKWADAIVSYEKALEIKPDFQPGRSRYINLVADNSRPN